MVPSPFFLFAQELPRRYVKGDLGGRNSSGLLLFFSFLSVLLPSTSISFPLPLIVSIRSKSSTKKKRKWGRKRGRGGEGDAGNKKQGDFSHRGIERDGGTFC